MSLPASGSNKDVPVLVVAFKRADALERCISHLKNCGVSRFYFAVDGPRNPLEAEKVEAVRRVIKSLPAEMVCQVRFASKNMGCRSWVSSSISWFFEHEDFGMVVEEDILIDPRFHAWCSAARSAFEHDPRIMHLNAFYPESQDLPKRSPHLTRYATSWGWATWKRAWRSYDDHMTSFVSRGWLQQLMFLKERMGVDWMTALHYFLALHMTAQGKLSSWAYRWNLSIWSANGVAVSPGLNLSQNIGVGGDASHTSHEKHLLQYVPDGQVSSIGLQTDDISGAVDSKIFAAVSRSRNYVRTARMLGSAIAPIGLFFRVRALFR